MRRSTITTEHLEKYKNDLEQLKEDRISKENEGVFDTEKELTQTIIPDIIEKIERRMLSLQKVITAEGAGEVGGSKSISKVFVKFFRLFNDEAGTLARQITKYLHEGSELITRATQKNVNSLDLRKIMNGSVPLPISVSSQSSTSVTDSDALLENPFYDPTRSLLIDLATRTQTLLRSIKKIAEEKGADQYVGIPKTLNVMHRMKRLVVSLAQNIMMVKGADAETHVGLLGALQGVLDLLSVTIDKERMEPKCAGTESLLAKLSADIGFISLIEKSLKELVVEQKGRAQLVEQEDDRLLTEYGITRNELTDEKLLQILTEHHGLRALYTHGDESTEQPFKSGAFGCLYSRKPKDSEEELAVKVIFPPRGMPGWNIRVRVLREAKAWSGLNDENILPLKGIWLNFRSGASYISFVSPYCSQGTLMEYLLKNNLDLDVKLELASQIAHGLKYMHGLTAPRIHRDLKIDNILIHNGHVRICDFGFSEVLDGYTGCTTKQHWNPRWVPPERVKFIAPPSAAGDIYNFGCVLLYILTGERPYRDCSESEICSRLLNGQTPDQFSPFKGCTIDSGYQDLMKACWRVRPDERPKAAEVVITLRGLRLSGQ